MTHPKDMGENEIIEFLSYLANERKVAAATQNQALNALVFLYRHVIEKEKSISNGIDFIWMWFTPQRMLEFKS